MKWFHTIIIIIIIMMMQWRLETANVCHSLLNSKILPDPGFFSLKFNPESK